MDNLFVQKDKITVTAVLLCKAKLKGEVFLNSFSDSHYGHQKVSDLLEGEKTFLPISILEENKVELLNKDQIVIIEGEFSSPEDKEKLAMGLYHSEEVSVTFVNEVVIKGTMISEVPHSKSRLSDCLNLEDRFITMIKESRYFHLNKSMITRVEALSTEKPTKREE